MDQITGFIDSITFISPDGSFTVAKLKEQNKTSSTCIVGSMPSIQPGETVQCEGEWIHHNTYGKQFEVKSYIVKAPSDVFGIQKYLESGLINGIGPVYAKKIVKKFGADTLDIIDNVPMRLLEISGIGKKRVEQIKKCWDEQKSIRQVMIFLRSHGVTPGIAQKIFKTYGNESIAKIQNNPYQLSKDIFGIGFKIADSIAKKLGHENDSEFRIESGIEYVLQELSNNGHTCFPIDEFIPIAKKILDVDESLIHGVICNLINKKELSKTVFNEREFIWLKALFFYESQIAEELLRLKNSQCVIRNVDIKKAIEWAEELLNIKFAKEQKEAIEKGVSEKVHITTGGPGTGKSTICRAIIEITKKLTKDILLAAPTGRAAKRLSYITRKKAFTIHSLLEFDFAKKGFKKNRYNPLECSFIIIDEASMIDSMLMYHLLSAIPDSTRILLIGDIDQLPSVGPGYVLKDIIDSETISITRLKYIYRQSKDSKIIYNAHRINEGKFPDITNNKSDFHFIEIKDPEVIQNTIVELVKEKLPKEKGFHPIDDIQVLAPMRKGKIGIENLNFILQEALNPSSKPFYKGGSRFHMGDKVMQIKNNYTKKVFNGDIGKISTIDLLDQKMNIFFDDRLVEYDFSELDEITVAYAVSIHKYQGSECQCIVMPIHTSHFKLLYKNLLYTGVTRGKKHVVLVGTKQAMAIAIKNKEVQNRYTGLEYFLKELNKR